MREADTTVESKHAWNAHLAVSAVLVAIVFACLGSSAATALAGDADSAGCPAETEASPGFRALMPDCRAYELVSPPYEDGQIVLGVAGEPPQMSADGEHLLGRDLAGFAETENLEQTGFQFGAIYEFSRTAAGWTAEALDPPASEYPRRRFVFAAADLSESLWEVYAVPHPGEELGFPLSNEATFAVREPVGNGKGRFRLVGPVAAPGHERSEETDTFGAVGASGDLAHIFFNVKPEDKQLWPGDSTQEGDSLYEYQAAGAGEPVLVGVGNEGSLTEEARRDGKPHVNEVAELVSRCGIVLGSQGVATTHNAIAANGETVYFTALHGMCATPVVNELYARVDGSRTVDVSEPSPQDCAACNTAGRKEAVFQGASEDGSKAFFTTEQGLLAGATGTGLYEYDQQAPEGERTILLASEVEGVVAISQDGARVYFESPAVLTGGANKNGEQAQLGAHNLYVYDTEAGRTAFVVHEPSVAFVTEEEIATPADTTRDGQFLLFLSADRVADTNDSSTVPQLFEYDADTEAIARVSVGQTSSQGYECEATGMVEAGYDCDGNTATALDKPLIVKNGAFRQEVSPTAATSNLSLTSSGMVVFMSRDALTPGSVAGGENVYEYRGGQVYLISPGDEAVPIPQSEVAGESRLLGVDESGRDIIFTSTDSLVPQDGDTQSDWYDAREDGGFPLPSTSPGCAGDTCQGAPSAPPQAPAVPASLSVQSPGSLPPQPLHVPVAAKPATRAQKLAKALAECKKVLRKRRRACRAQAERRYGAQPRAKRDRRAA